MISAPSPTTLVQVCKVYLGFFNDKPIRSDLNPKGLELFEKEQEKLLQDLYEIPQRSCDRKVTCLSLAAPDCRLDEMPLFRDLDYFEKQIENLRSAMGALC